MAVDDVFAPSYIPGMGANAKLYDRDFYAWTREQAALLRAGRLADTDLVNLAEEIESVGRSERREFVSRLTVLLLDLAKWRFQPNPRGRRWELTVKDPRYEIASLLSDNPSLRPILGEMLAEAWPRAVLRARGRPSTRSITLSCPIEPAR